MAKPLRPASREVVTLAVPLLRTTIQARSKLFLFADWHADLV
jgi:hypothetical protein